MPRSFFSRSFFRRKDGSPWFRRHDGSPVNCSQVWLQWSVGMLVTTPLCAVVQGSKLLMEYRLNHRHAPFPHMPARGVAVSINNDKGKSKKNYFFRNSNKNTASDQEPPLRILLIGDSLAAGVGVSKSGSPILPDSIARSLSFHLGGRMVYWTCVGTPGISAAQIVRDIHSLDDNHVLRQPSNRLELFVKEWELKRIKWQQRKDVRRRISELKSIDDEEVISSAEEVRGQKRKIPNAFKEWWNQIRERKNQSPSEIPGTTARIFGNWWDSVRSTVKENLSEIKEDLEDIKEIVQTKQGVDEDKDKDEDEAKADEEIVHSGDVFHHDLVDAKAVAAQYDIAIVLTGLNDIKEAFLPHMNQSYTKHSDIEGSKENNNPKSGVLTRNLQGVVEALEGKMEQQKTGDGDGTGTGTGTDSSSYNSSSNNNNKKMRQPLIVVPELPVLPLKLFRLVPLKWFVIPLFRSMENNKNVLSSRFPNYVLYVHQPDLEWWADVERGFGPIRDNLRQERLLFRQTDIALRVKERIIGLMNDHYGSDEGRGEIGTSGDNNDDHNPPDRHSSSTVEDNSEMRTRRRPGSLYVAEDQMHPNDEGYDLWGRHIAAAIIKHWEKRERERERGLEREEVSETMIG